MKNANTTTKQTSAKVYDLSGKVAEEITLPDVFSTVYKPVVIQRAVLAQQSSRRQPYGLNPLAGKRTSAHYHGKRKYRWSMMNKELARIARIHGKVGYMALRARFVPQAVKGRRAHGPKAEKVWLQKINAKELQLAIRSAIAATADRNLVSGRGHLFEKELPIIITDDFEGVKKTKDIKKILAVIVGVAELERGEKKKVRSGKGKMRGRKYKRAKGPLLVVSKDCNAIKSAKNIPGVDVVDAGNLDIELLAPGTHAGRLTIFTKAAVQKMSA